MAGSDYLSGRQFNTDRFLTEQGNPDEMVQHRGYQNLTSNVYKPPFANVSNEVQSRPSPARAASEEDED